MEVNPAELEKAAAVVDGAVAHFNARRAELHEIANEMHTGRQLSDGYGKTGGYQQGLQNFGVAFEQVLEEFIKDEDKFCAFLEGFRDRLRQSAGTYQETELANTQSMNLIGSKLDQGKA
ncbi:hypothetical protein G7043_26455 [Lentzea sp. NEAU-D13]|uniref:Excreted virulence factor EspC, type VII ESX diderm n=1 Tax=Lentzea alba TaxID=2714351 RepID=A0A7C9RTH9_9PSEU|nr:hypothetical protein [Lentzea alba]NGY62469.1 hypothetical protein [Lentzea alba]